MKSSVFGRHLTALLTRIIHERFYCKRGSAAATSLSAGGIAAQSLSVLSSTSRSLATPRAGLATRLHAFVTNRHELCGLMSPTSFYQAVLYLSGVLPARFFVEAVCLPVLLLGPLGHDARAEPKPGPIDQETVATDIKPGQQYKSGTRVRSALLGISFLIPAEWMGGAPQGSGSQSFLLGSNTKSGIGVVVLVDHVTPQELEAHMNEPQVLEEGFVLQPAASAKISGDRMAASYHAGDNVGLAVAVFGPVQQAIVYLFTGPKNQSAYYGTLLEQLAGSTRFTTLDPARLIKQWEELLSGMALKHLEQYSSGEAGGYNRSTVWNLCRDGRFTYAHSSHVTVQVPDGGVSDAGEERRRGTWRVETKGADVFLILTEDNGTVTSHAVGYDGEKTYVDSERVYRVESEECP